MSKPYFMPFKRKVRSTSSHSSSSQASRFRPGKGRTSKSSFFSYVWLPSACQCNPAIYTGEGIYIFDKNSPYHYCSSYKFLPHGCLPLIMQIVHYLPPFLAHLSRRLVGELIVYPWSGVRPSSVVVVHNFKHEYLCNQWADCNQILSEASLGWGKGCIRFWAR